MHWWDGPGWNPVSGCRPVTTGCRNCYAAKLSATQQTAHQIPIHLGTTTWWRGRPIFNGKLKALDAGHPNWVYPLTWPGARHPVMGPGKPSLLFVCDMADLFVDHRPISIINRVVGTVALSPHIGLLPSKFTRQMRDYFLTQKPETIQHWQRKLWLGFSAERQQEFDARWTDMRELADAGWTVFVSIAPMLAPVVLPRDFLACRGRAWAICSGEVCGPEARPMDPAWPRAIRDQCKPANVPFFMLQMSRKSPIPLDLRVWQFPRCDGGEP